MWHASFRKASILKITTTTSLFLLAVHEHGTMFFPGLHTIPVAVGTDTKVELTWELREKLGELYGDCFQDEKNVGYWFIFIITLYAIFS